MRSWASLEVTWNDPQISWTGGTPGRRGNFLMSDWYIPQQEPFQDVIDFAEGRTGDPFYV